MTRISSVSEYTAKSITYTPSPVKAIYIVLLKGWRLVKERGGDSVIINNLNRKSENLSLRDSNKHLIPTDV